MSLPVSAIMYRMSFSFVKSHRTCRIPINVSADCFVAACNLAFSLLSPYQRFESLSIANMMCFLIRCLHSSYVPSNPVHSPCSSVLGIISSKIGFNLPRNKSLRPSFTQRI
jgi:hypothetical protein